MSEELLCFVYVLCFQIHVSLCVCVSVYVCVFVCVYEPYEFAMKEEMCFQDVFSRCVSV